MKHSIPGKLKSCLFACLLVLGLLPVKGQYVMLPDTNLAIILSAYYNGIDSPCLVGRRLDTTCSQVLNTTVLTLYGGAVIHDLTGIQYFKNLDTMLCGGNTFPVLANLPPHLMYLDCSDWIGLDSVGVLPNTLVHFDCSLLSSTGVIGPKLPGHLPDSLQYFNCTCAHYDSLPLLPPHLSWLNCSYTQLPALPTLPPALKNLQCRFNETAVLPPLPQGLQYLDCGVNMFTVLPTLPQGLQFLDCDNNNLAALPALPDSLQNLVANNNGLTILPTLPRSLQDLNCSENQLSSIPVLPDTLLGCEIAGNPLTALPAFPNSIQYLDCSYDQISTLVAFPDSASYINCSGNALISLPPIPVHVYQLNCSRNNLTRLPPLPNDTPAIGSSYNEPFDYLDCSYNQLSALPPLPPSLSTLICDSNNLTSLPPLPPYLFQLHINFNRYLNCLPMLNRIYDLSAYNTPISCLPNAPTGVQGFDPIDMANLPLCGLLNTGGCQPFWNVSGRAYYDQNANCQFDSSDVGQGYIKINLYTGGNLVQQTFTLPDGNYSFKTGHATYAVQADASGLPFKMLCPAGDNYTSTITTVDSLSGNNDFTFVCPDSAVDLGVFGINTGALAPRPGDPFELYTSAGDLSQIYGAHCADGTGGQVKLYYGGPLHYTGPASGALTPDVINADTLIWNIADFGAVNSWASFNMMFVVDSSAVAGASVCFGMYVSAASNNDFNLNNNGAVFCIPVINSFDPNVKEVYPTGLAAPGEWLTYTLRFQNTGTAPAANIIVKDTLAPYLDASTLQLLSYSAKNITQLFGSVVNFNFTGINLPDSGSSQELSHGFVQFKVQVKSTLPVGAIIKNTASIYFDLNPPVQTNTVENCVPLYDTTSTVITCGDSIKIGSAFYKHAGSYNDTLTASSGCDSIITWHLGVSGGDTLNESGGICAGDSVNFYGTWIYSPGIYQTNLPGTPCDTTVILNLLPIDPLPPTHISDTICTGDSVLFGGSYYGATGNYTAHFSSQTGCDSTVILNLVLWPISVNTNNSSIGCGDSVSLDGVYYHLSGTYSDTLKDVHGCDSINQLQLTVIGGDTTYLSNTICSNDSALFNGAYYNQSGNYTAQYTSSSNCDSTVILQLTVNPAYNNISTQSILCGDSVNFNGAYYHLSGNYSATFQTINACDSVLTLQLTVTGGDTTYINDTLCSGDSVLFNGAYYGTSGSYPAQFTSISNCDSTVILQLAVNPLPEVTFTWDSLIAAGDVSNFQPDSSVLWCGYFSPNVFALQGGSPAGGHYSGQYIKNDTINLPDLSEGIDTLTYSYTDNDACAGSVQAYFSFTFCDAISSVNSDNLFTIYPNPADDYTMIAISPEAIGSTMKLFDITGKELMRMELTATPQRVPLSALPAGVYMVSVESNGAIAVKMLVKTE